MLSPEWIELSVSSDNQQEHSITYLHKPEDRCPTLTWDMYCGILDMWTNIAVGVTDLVVIVYEMVKRLILL